MSAIHASLLYIHIALGSIVLLLYWLPVFARKGSRLHINAGKAFYYLMLLVAGSGMLLSSLTLYDPVAIYDTAQTMTAAQQQRMLVWRVPLSQFLLLLSLLTWVTVRHAIGVLRARDNRALLRRVTYTGPVLLLIPAAIFVALQGIKTGMPLLIIFAVVSLVTAISICVYVYKAAVKPRAWIIEHFSAMVGSGIAVYTAFFAAGGRQLLAPLLPGQWQLLSWLAAPVIGVTVLMALKGYYQRKYNVQCNKALQQG